MQRHLLHKTWHAVLSGRGVLALEGRDTHKLLQGLVTSDVTALNEPQHTAFLAHNGRMLFDAFLIPGPADGVLIDAEAAAIPALAAHLRRYKLRSKVTFTDRTDDFAVVAICGQDAAASAAAAMTPGSTPDSGAAWADARLDALGYRQLVPRGSLGAAAAALPPAAPEELHGLLSCLLGVPNGAVDLPLGECVPHESNLELLGSIHFAKGCYLGQELTWDSG
jgi:folate-binding protein YgfZ